MVYPEPVVLRGLSIVLVALVLPAQASAFSRHDDVATMGDGVEIATSLYLPDGALPARGWPGVIVLHGLNGDRGQVAPLHATGNSS